MEWRTILRAAASLPDGRAARARGAGVPYGVPVSVDQNGSGAAGRQMSSDPVVLEREIEARRAHLAATVDELVFRAQPKEIARRASADAKAKFQAATTTPEGDLRTERIAAVAGAVLLFVVLVVWKRRRRSR